GRRRALPPGRGAASPRRGAPARGRGRAARARDPARVRTAPGPFRETPYHGARRGRRVPMWTSFSLRAAAAARPLTSPVAALQVDTGLRPWAPGPPTSGGLR